MQPRMPSLGAKHHTWGEPWGYSLQNAKKLKMAEEAEVEEEEEAAAR